MTTVTFSALKISDDKDALTTEGVYRKYANFAGVQSFSFFDTLNTFDDGHWGTNSGIFLDNRVIQTGTSMSDRFIWYDTNMPHSYVLEFSAHAMWGFAVRGNGSNTYYRFDYDFLYINAEKVVGGVVVEKQKKQLRPSQQPGSALQRIKIAVRDAQFTADNAGRTLHIAVWQNDYLLHTWVEDLSSNPDLKLALIVPSGNVNGTQYSDLRISNLGEIILLSSLDPGETPIGAIQRANEDRYIKQWMRWDGSMRVWSPKAREVSIQVDTDREYFYSPALDKRQGFSHLRVLGAFQWVQLKDDELVRALGHSFREIQNTSAWNIDDCKHIGLQLFIRTKEQVFQAKFTTTGLPYIEVEDRIQIPDYDNSGEFADYIVDSVNWDWSPGTLNVSLQLRKYYYGEP